MIMRKIFNETNAPQDRFFNKTKCTAGKKERRIIKQNALLVLLLIK